MKALWTALTVWEWIIADLVDECRANQVPCISRATRDLLIKYINQCQPRHYIEVWSAWGVSLFTAHQQLSQRWGTVVGMPTVDRVQQMIQDHQLTDIAIYHLNANQAGRDSIITDPIDFAFIDARKANYHIYLQTLLPHMTPNAMIICDDVIEFKYKLTPLYQFLDQNQMNYETITLSDWDWVIVIRL
jgi:predicted O-methyltransferase YrrM